MKSWTRAGSGPGVRAAMGLAAGLVLMQGCGSDKPAQAAEPPIKSMLVVEDMKAFTLPLDSYLLLGHRHEVFRDARTELVVRCLARFGFTLVPPTIPPMPLGVNERRYGMTSEVEASSSGYRSTAMDNRKDVREPELSPAAQTVLTGEGQKTVDGRQVPEGGCSGEAKRELTGGPNPQDDLLAEDLRHESFTRSKQDSRVRKVFADWSACMARAGYHYAGPPDANNDPAFATAKPTPAEIATAVADMRCKRETNLVNVWATVETAYQNRLVEANASRLSGIESQLQVQLRNAAAVVAGAR